MELLYGIIAAGIMSHVNNAAPTPLVPPMFIGYTIDVFCVFNIIFPVHVYINIWFKSILYEYWNAHINYIRFWYIVDLGGSPVHDMRLNDGCSKPTRP